MVQNREKDSYVKAAKETKKKRKRNSKLFASPNKGRLFHMMGKALGIITMLAGGMSFLALGIRNYNQGICFSYTNYFFGMVFLGGFIVYMLAYSASKRMARFRYYRTFLEDREFMCLSEISEITGRKVKFLQRDIGKMIHKKLFLQGHMNEQGTCLFLTEEMYQRYERGDITPGVNTDDPEEDDFHIDGQKTGSEFADTGMEEGVSFENSDTVSTKEDGSTDIMESFETVCDAQLSLMDHLIHQICDKQIKAVAAAICVRGKQIMYYKETEMGADVERFLLYYLPVTKTVLETYAELEQQEMEQQATDLRDILNTIQHSFDTFVEKLMEGKRMDIEADIAAVDRNLMELL